MARRRKHRPERRQADRRLTRVGLFSVAMVSFIVALLTAGMIFLAGLLLWRHGVGTGFVEEAEELVGQFTAEGTFVLDGPTLFAGWAVLSAMWAVVMTVVGVTLGVIVNVACFLTGGIRMRFRWKVPAQQQARQRRRHRREPRRPGGPVVPAEVDGQQRLDFDGALPEVVAGPAETDLIESDHPDPDRGEPLGEPARAA
jgi:hypothetical protein